MKIIIGGPAKSGKSVLRQALKQAMRAIPDAPYPYVITACPDGEGAWYQETATNDPDLAARLKAEYKSKFTWDFTRRIEESVRDCSVPFALIDLGGIIDDKNEAIARHASHAILIAAAQEDLRLWIEFSNCLHLKILAVLRSDYQATEDHIQDVDASGVFRAAVHHLERGEDASARPAVQALAQYLTKLSGRGSSQNS